jgi:PKD repeat protein
MRHSICPGEPVHFFDNSLSNGPGYNPVYLWSFPGGTPSVSNDPYPIVIYNVDGTYDVSLTIVNNNGTDSITKTTAVNVSAAPLAVLPLTEDFENSVFPPFGWNWNSASLYHNWNRSVSYGGYSQSTKSLAYFTWTNGGIESDYFTTPNLDLSTIPDPVLTFDYCYPYDYVDADTLKIFYSFDCGFTRNYIFSAGGLDLKTDSCNTNYAFSPDSSSWRTDTVSLYSLTQQGDLQLGFEVNSKTRCEVYIDNINIASVAGVGTPEHALRKDLLSVFPNPSSDQINITWNGNKNEIGKLMLLNTHGAEVWRGTINGSEQIHLSLSHFPNGIYTILLGSEHSLLSKKIVILR